MTEIKQSTATRELVFKLVQTTDGYTPVTSATPTVLIRKEGGSFASPAGAVTEIAHGYYRVAANATDTNTLGTLVLYATATGARPADMAYNVVANLESDTFARIGAPGAGDIANDIDALSVQVSALQNLSASDVRAELATELGRIDAAISSRSSHTAAAVWSVATRTLTAQSDSAGVTTLLTRLPGAITLTGGAVTVATNNDKTGYALATAPPTAGANATAVRAELATELARIDATVSSRNATAPDNAGIAAIKAKTDNLPSDPADQSLIVSATDAVMARLGAPAGASIAADIAAIDGGGGGGATAGEIADAVWDELLAGHVIPGSAGAGLAAASASGDPWASLLPGSYAEGTAGAGIGRLNLVPGDGPVIIIPDPSEDPGQCVIYVSTRDIDGTITPGVRIRITPRNGPATTAGGQLVGITPFDLITDADGFASAVLERVDLLTPANTLYYQVTATRYALDTTISPTTALFDLATIIVS